MYYGPNSRFAISHGFPEIFQARKKDKKSCKNAFHKELGALLSDETIVTGFPFAGLSPATQLHAMLPERYLCDQLVARYFECSNSLFNVVDSDHYWDQYPDIWSITPSPPASLLALTFFIVAIAARSLNEGHPLLTLISSEGMPGALKAASRWKKYGQMSLSQTCLFRTSSLTNIQAMLLLSIIEDADHVRWNMLGLVGNMARLGGLHRDPNVFQELDDSDRSLRRYQIDLSN
jgi:hypothetical protein